MADQSNPSEKQGTLSSQMFVTAVVVDNKDPNQTGRVRCRILGEQDDVGKIPDDKLPWYNCITNNQPQVGGIGSFPNGNYEVGSKIIMINMGQQGFFPIGSMPNNETDKSKQDRDMESTSTSKRDKTKFKIEKAFEGKSIIDYSGTQNAMRMLNNRFNFLHTPNMNPKKAIHMMSGLPQYLGSRSGIKVPTGKPPFTIGSFAHNMGDVTNPQSFIKSKLGSKGEMIPNALSITETLKKTAAGKFQIPAITSIGGMGNFTGAISGIMSMMKQAKSGGQTTEKELTLYEIYFQETQKNALDANKKETPEYKAWLKEYLIRIGQLPPQNETTA